MSETPKIKLTWDNLMQEMKPQNHGQLCAKVQKVLADMIEKHDEEIGKILQSEVESKNDSNDKRNAIRKYILTTMEPRWSKAMEGCSNMEASEISAQEKADKRLNDPNLVYGEVEFKSLGECFMKWLNAPSGGVFYDLGAGVGRGVFAAYLLHDFDRCVGIEIMEGLYKASVTQMKHMHDTVLSEEEGKESIQLVEEEKSATGCCEFIWGDLKTYPWWDDCTVGFANSTCFDNDLMGAMCKLSEKMKIGTHFFTLTRPLESPYWEMLEGIEYRMSWGNATIYSHRKIK